MIHQTPKVDIGASTKALLAAAIVVIAFPGAISAQTEAGADIETARDAGNPTQTTLIVSAQGPSLSASNAAEIKGGRTIAGEGPQGVPMPGGVVISNSMPTR